MDQRKVNLCIFYATVLKMSTNYMADAQTVSFPGKSEWQLYYPGGKLQ
jgi:hypothetical protein